MLGHGIKLGGNVVDDGDQYALQTIKDNVSLLTPEILDQINELVVKEGHKLVNKTDTENNENNGNNENIEDNKNNESENENKLHGKCDSYVVETDVHFPTDINLLFDAVRVMINLIAALCGKLGIVEWRQHVYCIGKIKKQYRVIMKLKKSTSKDEAKKAQRDQKIKDAYSDYIDLVQSYVAKCKKTIQMIREVFAPFNKTVF